MFRLCSRGLTRSFQRAANRGERKSALVDKSRRAGRPLQAYRDLIRPDLAVELVDRGIRPTGGVCRRSGRASPHFGRRHQTDHFDIALLHDVEPGLTVLRSPTVPP